MEILFDKLNKLSELEIECKNCGRCFGGNLDIVDLINIFICNKCNLCFQCCLC